MAQPSDMDAFIADLVTYVSDDDDDDVRTVRLTSAFNGFVSIPATRLLAQQELSRWARNPSTFVLYADGSAMHPVGGSGAAYLSLQGDGEWKGHRFGWPRAMTSLHAELAAVGEALRLAKVEVEASKVIGLDVAVVSDCKAALDWIARLDDDAALGLAPLELRSLLADIEFRARELNELPGKGVVGFLWIGGHEGVEGNERADRAAKRGAREALASLTAQITH